MPVSGVVPDVRSRIHMQHDVPFFQVSCFSKEGGMGVPVPPLSVAVTPGWSGRRTSLWIRPPEGEPSSDLVASPTGRGGDLGSGRGTRAWRAWDDAYLDIGRYHQAEMIGGHRGSGIYLCMSLAALRFLRIVGHNKYERL